jgi:hypothetical protein
MGGNYNEKGTQYETKALAHKDRTFGVLNKETKDFYDVIARSIAAGYRLATDENDKHKISFYKNIESCKSCLDGFLYQCSKLVNHNNDMLKYIPEKDVTDTMSSFSSLETCTDFEYLLYHG